MISFRCRWRNNGHHVDMLFYVGLGSNSAFAGQMKLSPEEFEAFQVAASGIEFIETK